MLERARETLRNIQSENESLRVSDAITNLDSLQKELLALRAEKDQFQDRAKTLEDIVRELKKDKESLFEQIESMKDQVMNHSRTQVRNEVKREMLEKMSLLQKQYQESVDERSELESTCEQLKLRLRDMEEQAKSTEAKNGELRQTNEELQQTLASLSQQLEAKEQTIAEMKSDRKRMVDRAQVDKLQSDMSEICTVLNIDSFDKAAPSVRRLVLVARGVNQWIQDTTSPTKTSSSARRRSDETSIIAEVLNCK